MFKLLRDSIFRPRNIIAYRAKPFWFSLLYFLMILVFGVELSNSRPFAHTKMTYEDKLLMTQALHESNGKIEDYKYTGTRSVSFEAMGFEIGFMPNTESLKEFLESSTPDFVVIGEKIYSLTYISTRAIITEVDKLSSYEELNGLDFTQVTTENAALNNFITSFANKFRWNHVLRYAGVNAGSIILVWFGITLISFIFMLVLYQANQFMKVGQLFKMLFYSGTAIALYEIFTLVLGISTIYVFVLGLFALIPVFALERQIKLRIRLYQMSKGLIKDEELMKKLQELNDKINGIIRNDNNNDNDEGDDE
ncbi:MAG: DUF1189 domain-containing protein [Gammaproteobacteria bacterium]|nr:DUF1189 domain-containing protein [Gammaproteobacteria bacterium]